MERLVVAAAAATATIAGAQTPAGPAASPEGTKSLQRVEITGAARPIDERAESVTTKIVVGREEIVQFGDRSVLDVLKRLPGVTVKNTSGGAPEIRMRGLGAGYTQILVNGTQTSPGFSLDSLAPESIERIEVVRAATAELGTQAIAGTVNIVLKQASSKPQAQFKASAGTENSEPAAGLSAMVANKMGSLSYSVVATADRRRTRQQTDLAYGGADVNGTPFLVRSGQRDYSYTVDSLSIAPRATWSFGQGDTLTADGRLARTQTNGIQLERTVTTQGDPLPHARTDLNVRAPVTLLSGNLQWEHPLPSGASLSTKLGLGLDRKYSDARVAGFDQADTYNLQRTVTSRAQDRRITFAGKYAAPLTRAHDFSLGWDGSYARRYEDRIQDDTYPLGDPSIKVDESYDARVERIAFFAQDEWKATAAISGYAGLRWEGLRTTSVGNVMKPVHSNSSVFSPILQVVWQLAKAERMRLGLTRTYKAPLTSDLMPRRFVAKNNTEVTPNYQGNADLRPELAWSLDAAYERAVGPNGSLSVSGYLRSIEDVIRIDLFEQNGVWINQPINGGKATAYGLEVDWKTPLPGKLASLTLKGNFGLNWSKVKDVPGPNNRLDQQVPLTANVGVDYVPKDSSLTAGASLGYQRGGLVRISSLQWSSAKSTRSLDLYGVWKVRPSLAVRFTAANLGSRRSVNRTTYQGPADSQYLETSDHVHPRLRLAIEWTPSP